MSGLVPLARAGAFARSRAIACAGVLAFLASTSVAAAQDDAASRRETAAARALFEEGVELFDDGRLDEATDRFRRSLAIRRTPSVMFNLAAVLVHRGDLVEGEQLFREVAAAAEASERLRLDARARADEIAPRIPRLTVRVHGDATSARIRIDELELSAAMIGVPIPVDPGNRHVIAEVDERAVFDRTIELAEGASDTITVTLDVATAEQTARAAALSTNETPAPAPSTDVATEWWFWTLIAVGVAALVTGGVLIGLEVDASRYFSGNLAPGRIALP